MDWGEASASFDELTAEVSTTDLTQENEAQTRYTVVNRMVREILGWPDPQVHVEERLSNMFFDYVLRSGDETIVVEAKRYGATFPNPTKRRTLRLRGSVLGIGDVGNAIEQVRNYALELGATYAVATNGRCWIAFQPSDNVATGVAHLYFPFEREGDAEAFHMLLSEPAVAEGSLLVVRGPSTELANRLLEVIQDADDRVDRNDLADYIAPVLDVALYADAVLSSVEQLEHNYVATEARSRFDALLKVHLTDSKPTQVVPARRVHRGKSQGELDTIVRAANPSVAPPVTLLIGSVGAGKSTYLKHYELVAGHQSLADKKAHWIYIDFEQMGPGDSPRGFLYKKLRDYLLEDHPNSPTDWTNAVEPAYDSEVSGLARGPLAILFTRDKPAFYKEVSAHIQAEFERTEPYVDRVLTYLSKQSLCVVVLDNIDLYEDEVLETTALAEGLAFSKRTSSHVLVSIRDRTFVRHKNDSVLDAYELKKLWIDPPPFRDVLAARLTFAQKVLRNKDARIPLRNGMVLVVPDLSVFFEIVQRSILAGAAGSFIEAIGDGNIRRGLGLVSNFLTSGHIQANRAMSAYIAGSTQYTFPFHEVFKGTMLGQWKRYKERRSECVNLFEADLGSERLQLLRLWILQHMTARAASDRTLEVSLSSLAEKFGSLGATIDHLVSAMTFLRDHGLVLEVNGEPISRLSVVAVTRAGAYYVKEMTRRFAYVDEVLYDTGIRDADVWANMVALTQGIEREHAPAERMRLRAQRVADFLGYLEARDHDARSMSTALNDVPEFRLLSASVKTDADFAVAQAAKYYPARDAP